MINGKAHMEGTILVVYALDGLMPETKEQVRLACHVSFLFANNKCKLLLG